MNLPSRSVSSVSLATICAIPFLFLASWSIWVPYSYWLDELFSVTTSLMPLGEMVDVILEDVHPPLYQALLKYWIEYFGYEEPQTRSLSLLAAFSAMAALIVGLRRKPVSFILPAVLFFGSAWLFAYYAQETRSYALLMFLAMIATLLDLHRYNESDNPKRFVWYVVLLALSLTHYFGLVYAGILLIGDLFRVRQFKFAVERLLLAVFILIWPLAHYLFGNISGKTGGNFWIQSDGSLTTLLTFGYSLLYTPVQIYQFLGFSNKAAWVLNGLVLFFLLALSIYKAKMESRIEIGRLSLYVVGFVAVVSIIDMHTPMSTKRNFIVLLPLMAILFAQVFHTLWVCYQRSLYRSALSVVLIGYVAASTYYSLHSMQGKWGVPQNWKGLASAVESRGFCDPPCWFLGGPGRARIYSYYFASSMGMEPHERVRDLSQLVEMSGENKLPIIAAHVSSANRDELMRAYPGWKCFEPNQSWKSSVLLLMPEVSSIPGLKSCR